MQRLLAGAERRFVLVALALGVFAAAQGLAYLPFVSPHTTMDTPLYLRTADAILHGRYSIPLPAVDETFWRVPRPAQGVLQRETTRTPGYPLLLAAVGGGDEGVSRDLLYLVQALLCGAGVFLVGLTARRLWGPRIGLLACALYAVDPFSKRDVSLVLTEALAGFLAAAGAYAFVRAAQTRDVRWWACAGGAIGAATLTRPVFALAVPCAVVAALVMSGVTRARLAAAGACAFAALVLIGPWVAWTDSVSGRPTLAAFGEGWNLLLAAYGEGPRSTAEVVYSRDFTRDFVSVHRLAPTARALLDSPNAHARYLVRADTEQRRLARHVYARRLGDEPVTVAGEILYRAAFLWSAHRDWHQPPGGASLLLLELLDALVIALGLVGIVLALRERGPAGALAIFLLLYTALNAVHHVEARYGTPLRGLVLAFAALALGRLLPRVRRGRPA